MLEVKIDITTWQKEGHSDEILPSSHEEIMDAIDSGISTARLARSVIVAREEGIAPDDIIRSNDLLLQFGAMGAISTLVRKHKTEIHLENGKTYQVPTYIGKVTSHDEGEGEPGEEPSYIRNETAEALERTRDYLERVIPGHIWNTFLKVYANGGDVETEAVKLKVKINEFVDKLTQGVKSR